MAGGYWNLPEATAETFKDGWLHTGDMAREDEDGFYFIVDRVKDMIVTGGFNVFPREVEDVVAEHPAVAQVCVVGAPDEKWGEAVTAVVVLRADAARDDAAIEAMTAEIQAAVKDRKGSVQSPKRVVIVDVAAADRAGQAGQEGRAGAVLGRRRARGRLRFARAHSLPGTDSADLLDPDVRHEPGRCVLGREHGRVGQRLRQSLSSSGAPPSTIRAVPSIAR